MHAPLTPEKTLRSGHSVWQDSGQTSVATLPLRASLKVDVAIVGAGISGALVAHALAPRYDKVAVVDRRTPFSGATSASTAMLQFEIDEPLRSLGKKIGPVKAARAWRRSLRATKDLVRMIRAEGIKCGLQDRDALYLAGSDLGGRALRAESEARNRIGIPGTFLDRRELQSRYGIAREGAILSSSSAVANPRQLAAGLLRRAGQSGATIYSPVDVTGAFCSSHGVVLNTGKYFIEAKYVVFCTGYEVLKGVPRKGTKITSSWAVASRPQAHYPTWLDRTIVWEAATPYLYLRTTPDRRIIVGGEDEDIDLAAYRNRALGRKSQRLVAKAEDLIPNLSFDPTFEWTGAFGESDDGLPIVDAVPDMPGCFAIMGFGGNGTIYSMIAAQLLPLLLRGRTDKDAALYRFRH